MLRGDNRDRRGVIEGTICCAFVVTSKASIGSCAGLVAYSISKGEAVSVCVLPSFAVDTNWIEKGARAALFGGGKASRC